MVILQSGNVGIGTTSPSRKLTISDSSQYAMNTLNPTSTAGNKSGIAFHGLNSQSLTQFYAGISANFDNTAGGSQSGSLIFETINGNSIAERMRINSSGSVGIGTTNPQMGLHVGSGSQSTAALPGIGIANGSSAYSFYQASDGTKQYIAGVDHNITYTKSGTLSNHDHAIITNNINRIYIQKTGNVGIGTTSPSFALDVQAANGNTLARFKDSDSSHSGIVIAGDTNAGWVGNNVGVTGEGIYYQSSDNLMRFYTNSAEKARIDTGGTLLVGKTSADIGTIGHQFLSDAAGDYAAHTSNGTRALLLNRKTSDGQIAEFRKDGSVIGSIGSNASGGSSVLDITASAIMRMVVGGSTEAMRVTSAGNVGIGTTSPNFPLHINKGTSSYTPTSGVNENVFGINTSGYTDGRQGVSFSRLDGNWIDGTSGTDTAYGWVWSYQNNVRGGLVYDHRGSERMQLFSSYGALGFITPNAADGNGVPTDSNMVERLTILAGGNVGIGTTSPGRKLQVKGTGNTAIAITSPNTNYVQLALGDTDDDNYAQLILDNATNKLQLQNGGGGVVGNRGITLDSSENVGIGTSSPANLLHVNSGTDDWPIRAHSTDAKAGIILQDTNTTNYLISESYTLSIGNQASLHANNLNIKSTGKVGLGTTSPSKRLHVVDSASHQLQLQGSNSYWNIGTGWSGYYQDFLLFATSSGEKMVIDTAGKVGIGTNSPAYKLDLGGTTASTANTLRLHQNNGGTAIRIGAGSGSSDVVLWRIDGDSTNSLHSGSSDLGRYGFSLKYFGTGSGQENRLKLLSDNGGNSSQNVVYNVGQNGDINFEQKVGIGTTAPKSKLQVEEYGVDTTSTASSATTQIAVHSFAAADFRSARFTVQVTNSTDSTYHTTELLLVHNGTTANITEFGEIHTGSAVEATFDADISSGYVRLLATPASTDTMAFKVVCHSITT